MDKSEFRDFVISLEEIFASLYMLDVGSMSGTQKLAHQSALNVSYLAMLAAQNQELANLNDNAKARASDLAVATEAMQKQLAGLKKTSQVLKVVGAGLNILSSVVKLFS